MHTTCPLLLATYLFMLPASEAFFRVSCPGTLVHDRVDPIVSPGKPSGHMHIIFGGNGFSMNSTYDTLRASTCTSCQVAEVDKSAYWVPQLYFKRADGTHIIVPSAGNGGMLIYYIQRPNTNPRGDPKVHAFPAGLEFVFGNASARSLSDLSEREQQAISFTCLHYPQDNRGPSYDTPHRGFPKPGECTQIRANYVTPSCWNGRDLKSPNFKSHMSYPTDFHDLGQCPDGWIKVPTLLFEMWWQTDHANFTDPTGKFVWSTGDDTGYGYHGDFQNGWQVDVLQDAMDQCLSERGDIQDCGVLQPHVQSDKVSKQCSIKQSVPEDYEGPMTLLPGEVQSRRRRRK